MSNFDSNEVVFRRDPQSQQSHDEIWDDTALIEAYDRAVGLIKEEIASRNNSRKTTKTSETNNAGKKPKKCKKNKQKVKKWKVGDVCEAIYSEDGLPYAARIKSINSSMGSCVVEYVGYGNIEELPLEAIRNASPNTKFDDHLSHNEDNSESINVDATSDNDDSSSFHCFHHHSHHTDTETGCHHHMPHWSPFMNGTWPFVNPPPLPPVWPMNNFPSSCQHSQTCNARSPKPLGIPPLPQMTFENADDALASTFMAWYMSGYHTGYYHAMKHHSKSSTSQTEKN